MAEKIFKTIFSIANIPIVLYTVHPIRITEGFKPFLTEKEDDGFIVEFFETEEMCLAEGQPLFYSITFAVYEDKEGLFRIFHDHKYDRKDRPYAVGRVYSGKMEKIWYQKESARFFSESQNTFSHIALEDILLRRGAMILHASFIETKYGAILFTGPSGIGKSTQADLWIKYREAELINGDRSILKKTQEGWNAYGSPYAGSSRCYVNKSCIVKAIIVLEKADECKIQRLHPATAFIRIYSGLTVNTWNKAYVEKISEIAGKLVQEVPIYLFRCTPDENAVNILSDTLEMETNNYEN